MRRLVAPLAAIAALAAPATAAADWTTFGGDTERSGFNRTETAIAPGTAGSLAHRWSYDLGGVVNAQPLYAADMDGRDVVYAGSEAGRFAALDAASGTPIWTRRLTAVDTICNDVPRGIHGISATPVLDRRRGTVWVAGGDGRVWALDMSSGRTRRGWPVRVGRKGEHVWGALALARGRLYVATASHCNNAFYRGRVVALHPETGRKRAQWRALGRRAYGGGVWGWGGVTVSRADGRVYVATANAQGQPKGHVPYAEHVVRLSARLRLEQANDPGPPRNDDNDFTGAPVLFDPRGCPPLLAVMHKTGQLFLYDRRSVARGPRQRIQAGSLKAFVGLGTYAWSPEHRTLYLANGSSGRYAQGMVALRLDDECRLRRAWEQPLGEEPTWPTPPVVANDVVVFGDGSGRTLHALDARTGARLWDSGGVTGDLYGAPIVAGGRLFAPSWDQKVHAFGM
ncbi:MAG: PQQ-binding-like beta-propeller repeat protein [Actinomycetota bacterium]|nr:PQQ-binding-like beta-propeller repeat protein [Actinomycetota bacterium]